MSNCGLWATYTSHSEIRSTNLDYSASALALGCCAIRSPVTGEMMRLKTKRSSSAEYQSSTGPRYDGVIAYAARSKRPARTRGKHKSRKRDRLEM